MHDKKTELRTTTIEARLKDADRFLPGGAAGSIGDSIGILATPGQEINTAAVCPSHGVADQSECCVGAPLGDLSGRVGLFNFVQASVVGTAGRAGRRVLKTGAERSVALASAGVGPKDTGGSADVWPSSGARQHDAATVGGPGALFSRRSQSTWRGRGPVAHSGGARFGEPEVCALWFESFSAQRSSGRFRCVGGCAKRRSRVAGLGVFCARQFGKDHAGGRFFSEPLAREYGNLGRCRSRALGFPEAIAAAGPSRPAGSAGSTKTARALGGGEAASRGRRRTASARSRQPKTRRSVSSAEADVGLIGLGDLCDQRSGFGMASQNGGSGLWSALAYRNDLQSLEKSLSSHPSARRFAHATQSDDLWAVDLSDVMGAGVRGRLAADPSKVAAFITAEPAQSGGPAGRLFSGAMFGGVERAHHICLAQAIALPRVL